MSMLWRKLLRDLLRDRWQYLSISVMVLLGVGFLLAASSVYANLRDSYDESYRRLEFEDFGIAFHAAPERVVERVRRIPGVRAAEGRLVEDVAIELPGRTTKKLVGRMISLPPGRELSVNRLKRVQGRGLRGGTEREILLEASFAKFHKLVPGDAVRIVRGAAWADLRVAGIVQSDEYLYVVRSKQDLIAMPDTFGVMFCSEDVLGLLLGKTGLINEIRVTVADPKRQDVIQRAAFSALAAYDPEDPVARTDQPSYQFLEQDVRGFQSYSVLFPALFLSVAAVSVYALISRVIHQQRPVIGLLRSLGFSTGAIVGHYLSSTLLIGSVSSLLGCLLGIGLGGWLSRLYMSQLQVPYEQIMPRWGVLSFGLLVGIFACAASAVAPALQAGRIRPAEAMRPLTPSFGRRSLRLDTLFPQIRLLWRIPLRNVFRQPRRTLSTLIGIIAGMCLMITAQGLLDSMQVGIDAIVGEAFQFDYRLDFSRHQSHGLVGRVRGWPGVTQAEGVLDVPVEMTHQEHRYSALISGLEPGSRLHYLRNERGELLSLTSTGAIFGPTLRKRLALETGDMVELTLPEHLTPDRSRSRLVRVEAFHNESIGTGAYLPLTEVRRLFRSELELPPNAISSITVRVEPRYQAQARSRLLALPNAASVLSIVEIRRMVHDLVKTVQRFVAIMQLFGAVLAFAMIFNMVTVNVLERASEVATLRTIGVSRGQVAGIIFVENLIITALGIVLGLPAGRLFVELFWRAAQTEEQQDLFTFQIVVLPATYVTATVLTLVVAVVSQLPSLRYIGGLDLARATKERSA
jgi:putative ABC transport system permease protein